MTSEVCHEYRAETADSLVTVYCLGVGQAPAALTGAELTLSMMSPGSVLSGLGPPASWNQPRSGEGKHYCNIICIQLHHEGKESILQGKKKEQIKCRFLLLEC